MTSVYSFVKKRFTRRYPTSYVYADQIEDEHIRYKAKEVRKFFEDLQAFLEHNRPFFDKFSRLMRHKIKIVNPENEAIIQKDGFEYIGDTINVFTNKGVFQIRFDLEEEMK